MAKSEYFSLLLTPQWKAKRARILKRDNYACTKCGKTKNLHVHHKYYLSGKKPWEYEDKALETLCKGCHKHEHNIKDIKDFTKKNANKKPKQIAVAKKKKASPPVVMNGRQKDLVGVKKRLTKRAEEAKARLDQRRNESPIYSFPEYQHLRKTP